MYESSRQQQGIPDDLEEVLLRHIESKCSLFDIGKAGKPTLKNILDEGPPDDTDENIEYPCSKNGGRRPIIQRIQRLKALDQDSYDRYLAKRSIIPNWLLQTPPDFKMPRTPARSSRGKASPARIQESDESSDDSAGTYNVTENVSYSPERN
jgi:hypothetical protein